MNIFFFYTCIYSHIVSHLFCILIQTYARSLERGRGPGKECDLHVETSGLLVCIDLERGKVLGTRPGDSSGSVCSEDKSDGPSSTTRVGIAPLPCSIDTTFSWEQFLQHKCLLFTILLPLLTLNTVLYLISILPLSISGGQLCFPDHLPLAAALCYQREQQNYTAPVKSVHQAAMGTALRSFFLHGYHGGTMSNTVSSHSAGCIGLYYWLIHFVCWV